MQVKVGEAYTLEAGSFIISNLLEKLYLKSQKNYINVVSFTSQLNP